MCLAYSLLVPRFKDYTYVLLIAPAFEAVLRESGRRKAGRWLMLPFLLSAGSPIFEANLPLALFWQYYPLWLAIALWLYYAREIRRSSSHV